LITPFVKTCTGEVGSQDDETRELTKAAPWSTLFPTFSCRHVGLCNRGRDQDGRANWLGQCWSGRTLPVAPLSLLLVLCLFELLILFGDTSHSLSRPLGSRDIICSPLPPPPPPSTDCKRIGFFIITLTQNLLFFYCFPLFSFSFFSLSLPKVSNGSPPPPNLSLYGLNQYLIGLKVDWHYLPLSIFTWTRQQWI